MPFKIVPGRDRKLNRLVKKGATRELRRGQALYRAGDPGGEVYLVTSGLLLLTAQYGGRTERTVDLAGPMELAGEEGLVPGAHRWTNARAETSSQVVALEGKAVAQTLQTATRTFHAFLQGREGAIDLARIPGIPRSSGGARGRLAAVLLHLAGRFGQEEEGGVRISVRLTHQILADLSASHRSTVTTLLNDWIYDEVLEGRGKELRILHPKALTALSHGTGSLKAPGGKDSS